MTAFELSESKVKFTRVYEKFFEKMREKGVYFV